MSITKTREVFSLPNVHYARIYEKVGFEINEVIEAPKLKYIMKRYR